MTQSTLEIISLSATQLDENLHALADLLIANVQDGASVSFILPITTNQATSFWAQKVRAGVAAQTRILLVAKVAGQLAGSVQLDFNLPPNQPHRAEIAKLLVHPNFRRQGIANKLMQAAERFAKQKNFQLLTLDTASEGAKKLYAQLGYQQVGVIPNFALNAQASQLEATTIMFKII